VPAPATAPAPAAPPAATAAPAPAAPSPVAGLRSAAQGNCPECGSGEWAATGEQAAAALATGVDCGAIAAAARPGLTALAHSAPQPAERGYAGPVVAPVPAGSPCSVVAIVLPGDARYVGYRYEAVDGWGGGDCVAEKPCAIGSGHWLGHPTIERGQRIVVWAVYVNQSAERSRRARLTAYFRPGATFAQPSQ
jgi:hypothetical protein